MSVDDGVRGGRKLVTEEGLETCTVFPLERGASCSFFWHVGIREPCKPKDEWLLDDGNAHLSIDIAKDFRVGLSTLFCKKA